jgi:formylglycine-generating enzyme required for sulfatase activity
MIAVAPQAPALGESLSNMVLVPGGQYTPFFPPTQKKPDTSIEAKKTQVKVDSFWMDKHAVTKSEFLTFLKKHPKWRKSQAKQIFTDSHYLSSWKDDLDPPAQQSRRSPVTEVSWFIAEEYCESLGKTLPTVDQWEYAANDQGHGTREAQKKILEWYSHPNSEKLPEVGSTGQNHLGIQDLHGLIWEWTLDYNNSMVSEESRENGTTDGNLFCGSGSQGALDPSDYASFMRYSFRSSLKANYTTGNLGFRCVKENNK